MRTLLFSSLVSFIGLISFERSAAAQTVLTKNFSGEDRSGESFSADVCYHSKFHQMTLVKSTFKFDNVMRFCNFSETHAEEATFTAYLYTQEFRDSFLDGSTFHLKQHPTVPGISSNARFVRTKLDGAKFYGDVSGLQFEDCSLKGVTVNDQPCEGIIAACSAE